MRRLVSYLYPFPFACLSVDAHPLVSYTRNIVDTPIETQPELISDNVTHAPDAETPTTTTPVVYNAPGTPVTFADAAATALDGGRADDPAWGLTAGFGVWFSSVGLMLLGGVAALILYFIVRPSAMNAAGLQRALESDPLFILLNIAMTVPIHLLTFGVAWAVVTGFGKRPFREAVGWSWGGRFGLWTCVALAIGLWLFGILLATVFGGQETDIDKIISSSNAARFSLAFLAVATAPIVEETVYRGVLFPPLARAAGMKWGIVIVSLMFAGIHYVQYWNNVGVIAAVTVLSFALTWVRARTGRLLPCFAIHAAFNGIQAVIIVAQPYLKTLIPTQPTTPPTAGMLLGAFVRSLSGLHI
ncbi:MAG: protease family protein [Pyrinomonadaceae bacterium]|nr:protease family protein [Pyrinomonadaceae bacterium]